MASPESPSKASKPGRTTPAREGAGKFIGRWAFAALFVIGGIGHFVAPGFYVRMMPPYLPWHRPLVLVSGGFEIALGVLLLIPRYSRLAAWGLVALLIAVFPANIHVFQHQDMFPLPPLIHLLRLPFQGVLIYWAYVFTKRQGRVESAGLHLADAPVKVVPGRIGRIG